MELEVSLRHSQEPANCPYFKPDQSSPCTHIPLPEDPLYHYIPNCVKSHVRLPLLTSCQRFSPIPMPCKMFRNMVNFYSEGHPFSAVYYCLFNIFATIIIIIIIIYLFTAIRLSPGGSGYFTCKQNTKLVTTRFKSGGLHEKHVVATWNVGNRLSICL